MTLMEYTEIEGDRVNSINYVVGDFLFRKAGSARIKNQPLKCKLYGSKDHCPVRAYLEFAEDKIKVTGQHNHAPPDIERQKLRRQCYQKAASDDSRFESPRETFDNACRDQEFAAHVTYKECQSTMYRRRAEAMPRIPDTIDEYIDILLENSETLGKHFKGGLKLENAETHFGVLFGTDYLIEHSTQNSDFTAFDGTFFVVPTKPNFYQLFTVFVAHGHHFFPLVTALMDGKCREKYDVLFSKIKELIPGWEPTRGMADFESASRSSAEAIFEGLTVHGCLFHESNAVYKQVLTGSLQKKYQENKPFCNFVKKLMAIPMLPSNLITETYETVLREMFTFSATDNQLVARFKQYIRNYWMRIDPVNLSVHGLDSATNNGCESFHAKLKLLMPMGNTPIWHFTHKLNDVLSDKTIEFQRLQRHGPGSIVRNRRAAVANNIQNRRNAEHELELGLINPLQFLERVSYTFKDQVEELQRDFRRNPRAFEERVPNDPQPEPEVEAPEPQHQNVVPENTCAVCLDDRGDVILAFIPCGHANSCERCIEVILRDRPECPECRVQITSTLRIFRN